MTSDEIFTNTVCLAMALHFAVSCVSPFVGVKPILYLNIVSSASMLAFGSTQLVTLLREPRDAVILLLLGFEGVVLGLALLNRQRPVALVWFQVFVFGLHLCASVAAVIFAFTFRLNRLI